MHSLKTALCLVAIVAAYGIAGQMDLDDAERLQQAQRSALRIDCPADEPIGSVGPDAQPTKPVIVSGDASSNDANCAYRTF